MVTLIKYGALGGGEKYNVNQMWIDGLSTDSKPTTTIDGMGIPNGSVYTEVDTGKTYMFDYGNATWYEVSIGGGGGGTSGGIVLVGTTTTQLTDGATTNPITVDGQSYTAHPNDAVIYQNKEFLFDGTNWHEFGDLSGLSSNDIGAMTNYTIASTGAAIVASDTLNQAIGKVEKRVTDTETKTDRIIMDNTETQDYYMQDSTPSNPVSGDYWFSDEPLLSSDITAMTGYAKAQTASAIVATDSLNQAIGKLEKGLDGKQATIDANNKLSADNVDDSNTTHKFATAAQLTQIGTNENDILTLQGKTVGMSEGGSDYIVVGDIRVYVKATAPTGNIPVNSLWIGG